MLALHPIPGLSAKAPFVAAYAGDPNAAEPSVPASAKQERIAVAVAILITAVACVAMPFARLEGPVISAFLPTYASTVLVMDLITAILFILQFQQHGRASTLVLGCAYLFSSLIVLPHLLTFPGVFAPTGLLGATPQTAVWLWVFWHSGFPLLVMFHALLLRRENQLGMSGGEVDTARASWQGVALVAGVVLALSLVALFWVGALPAIIQKDNYLVLVTSGVGPTVLLLNIGAVVALWRSSPQRSPTQLWLVVAMLASTLDVLVTLTAGARYSLGWYVARANSVICASLVLGAFLYEFHRLQTMLATANRRLATLADTDALTSLGNRRAFDRKLAQEWGRAARAEESLGLLLLDVDHFKAYNDTYGHQAGDACLQKVAGAIRDSLHRPSDFAARYGGEEMAVILPQTGLEGALHVAEAVRVAIESLALAHTHSSIGTVTVSIGVAVTVPGSDPALSSLVARADAALYHSKNAGRNRVYG